MLIQYKGLEHGVICDAPFIGARICAIGCHLNCPGCQNQALKDLPYQEIEDVKLIEEVMSHSINKGIIFGGLEWSEQPTELLHLVNLALQKDLKVMIYTGLTLKCFLNKFLVLQGVPVWVKSGAFDSLRDGFFDQRRDVQLASDNQKITFLGENEELYLKDF